MADNVQIPNVQPKAYILSFNYRRTGMGGFSDVILISFRSKKPIKSVLTTSRSGNHGRRSYRLFPGRYIAWDVDRSNGGNLYVAVKILRLSEDGNMETEKEWQVFNREPILSLSDLPEEIASILMQNRDELPLFTQVFPFDQQDNQQDNQEGM